MRYRIGVRKHASYSLYLDAGSEEELGKRGKRRGRPIPNRPTQFGRAMAATTFIGGSSSLTRRRREADATQVEGE